LCVELISVRRRDDAPRKRKIARYRMTVMTPVTAAIARTRARRPRSARTEVEDGGRVERGHADRILERVELNLTRMATTAIFPLSVAQW